MAPVHNPGFMLRKWVTGDITLYNFPHCHEQIDLPESMECLLNVFNAVKCIKQACVFNCSFKKNTQIFFSA